VKPKVWDDLVLAPIDGELVIYNPRESGVHHLNAQAALALQCLDGTATLKEIAEDIAEAYGLDAHEVRRQIKTIYRDFQDQGLIEGTQPLVPEEAEPATHTETVRDRTDPELSLEMELDLDEDDDDDEDDDRPG
jgi:PqqD family protein of HPr-rel-A system